MRKFKKNINKTNNKKLVEQTRQLTFDEKSEDVCKFDDLLKNKLGFLPLNIWDITDFNSVSACLKYEESAKKGYFLVDNNKVVMDFWDLKKILGFQEVIKDVDKKIRSTRHKEIKKLKKDVFFSKKDGYVLYCDKKDVNNIRIDKIEVDSKILEKDKYEIFYPSAKDNRLKIILKDNEQPNKIVVYGVKYMEYPFSEFNPALCKRIIEIWSNKGDLIVDPFSGRATRAAVSVLLQRNYIGFEIAPKTYEFILKRLEYINKSNLKNPFHMKSEINNNVDNDEEKYNLEFQNWCEKSISESEKGEAKIILGDGCKLEGVKDNSADMIMTCPPYWTVEKYESTDGQLSDMGTYGEFLNSMEECAKNCYRVLKPGKFMIWVVSDFRHKGEYKGFSSHLRNIFEITGFVEHDYIVNKLYSTFAARGVVKNFKKKRMSKTTEYIMVFRKPDENNNYNAPVDEKFIRYSKYLELEKKLKKFENDI